MLGKRNRLDTSRAELEAEPGTRMLNVRTQVARTIRKARRSNCTKTQHELKPHSRSYRECGSHRLGISWSTSG